MNMFYPLILSLLFTFSGPVKIQGDHMVAKVEHSSWDALLKKHVDNNGNVNYEAFLSDKDALTKYLKHLEGNPISNDAQQNEKLAYYINLYNAGTVQLILDNYPVKSIKDISRPWDKEWITIGVSIYSLGDIEHKILRKMEEPRIHFAINCASYSCPKLLNEAFTASQMDAQLERAAKEFINDPKRNKITSELAEISEIFSWFKKDFTQNGSLVQFLNKYSKTALDKNTKFDYLKYNWSLNDVQ